ncbi:ATP-dependent helicase [endosymbiont of Pachyrhynchus infernalis]|uniref:ATP-dependent helicase n=1 Tax=endosymbiont of Pachyrhynchus infernalis TaxID=1971488 RepID=UPI0038B61783
MNNNFLKFLNENQKKAVCSNSKNILVLAGAGSGKTMVIIYRIIWFILNKNINPNSILTITFTNKASDEINNRIKKFTNNNSINSGTFHSISYKILKIYHKYSNLSNDFQIINNYDQLKIIKNIISLLKLNEKNYNCSYILKYINSNKENIIRENNIICKNDNDYILLEIYKKYQKLCNKLNLVDFSELLIRSYELLLNNKDILNKCINKFNNILIDEFQDINKIQYFLSKILINNDICNSSTIVGDNNQSIYGWRGSNINNMNNLLKDFSNVEIIYLNQNYRSTKNIIKVANSIISNNSSSVIYNKKLWTNNNYGNLINIYKANNEIEESKFISNFINKDFKSNLGNKNYAILYRNNYKSRIIEEYLIYNNLSYKIYGGLKFLDRQEIKNSISYIRLIDNTNDNIAYEKIVNFPPRRIGNKTLELIKNVSKENNISYWDSTIYIINNNKNFKKVCINSLINFVNLIKFIKKDIIDYDLPDQIYKIINYSGIYNFYKLNEYNNNLLFKTDNINELINSSKQFFDKNKNFNIKPNIKEFLSHLLLKLDYIENNNNNNIQLMTIHSSKGLEFDTVFISGMENGIFPSQESLIDNFILEEERRLFYVALTRAIKNIIITYSEYKYIYGKVVFFEPSKFLKEIPNKFIKII